MTFDDLSRLVYVSRSEIPGDDAAVRDEIARIAEASTRTNGQAGVTGALLCHQGCVAQVLEGTHRAIEQVFARVQRDPRHSGIAVLLFEPVGRRLFPDSPMAHVEADPGALAAFAEIPAVEAARADRDTAGRVVRVLRAHAAPLRVGDHGERPGAPIHAGQAALQ